MEQNNRSNSSNSRFSGEERARITAENAKARAALKKEAENYRNAEKDATKEKTEKNVRNNFLKNTQQENIKTKADKRKSAVAEKTESDSTASVDKNNVKRKSDFAKKKARAKQSAKADKGSRNERVRTSTEKRKKDTKMKNALIVSALFTSAACIIALLCIVILKINTIEVVNNERYTAEEIINASGIKKGSSMLFVNADKISEKIEELLPYAEEAKIERQWPDKVRITIETATATFAVDTGSGYILLNDDCKVLEASADFLVSTAATLKGISIEKCVQGKAIELNGNYKTEDIVNLISAMRDSNIGKITAMDLSDDYCAVIVLEHRIEVKLGMISGADEKLLKFAGKVIEITQETDSTHEIIIDLTGEKEAIVRSKNSNEVIFEKEPSTEAEQFG